MKPEMPWGSDVITNSGSTSSLRASGRGSGVSLVEGVEHHADDEEQRELREDDDAAQDEPGGRLLRRSRREQALDEELIGAVRRQRQRDRRRAVRPRRCRPAADRCEKSNTRK